MLIQLQLKNIMRVEINLCIYINQYFNPTHTPNSEQKILYNFALNVTHIA